MTVEKATLCALLTGALLLAGGCGQDRNSSVAPIITPPQEDNSPPVAPSGLGAPGTKIHADGFLLTWTANAEPDLAGYRVYQYDPDPNRFESYSLLNASLLLENRFIYLGDMGSPVTLRVSAVDQSGTESALSAPITVSFNNADTGRMIMQGAGGNYDGRPGSPAPGPGPGHDAPIQDQEIFSR
jgi:hypothetical protein